jgi:hypothetical protein
VLVVHRLGDRLGEEHDALQEHPRPPPTPTTGSAHWEARYLFSATGRKVHNIIDARFELRDGKIVRHADSFDLWRWSGMALGAKGKLLGWAPPIKNAIHRTAIRGLEAFEAKQRATA